MKKVLSVLLALLWAQTALAATATLLPNGQQQFTDGNGVPYASGTVCFYIPSSLTAKQTWQDAGETTPNASPCITLDANGRAIVYGSGQYRQILKDSLGNLVWDQLTNQLASAIDVQNGGPFWGGTDSGLVNAYVLTINDPPVGAYTAGQRFQFIPAHTNTLASTLNVNALGGAAIQKPSSGGPVALTGGELVAGNIIDVEYDGTEFQLLNQLTTVIAPDPIPTGAVAAYSVATPPTGWLECNGAAVSRVTYAALFAIISTTYGSGDGSTTFNLPDMRGYFLRGYDHGRGVDSGRAFATNQADAFQGHTFDLTGASAGSYQFAMSLPGGPLSLQSSSTGGQFFSVAISVAPISDGTNGAPRTASQTRPINLDMLYIIKY